MMRTPRTIALLLTGPVALAVSLAASAPATAAAAAARPAPHPAALCATAEQIQLNGFAFFPAAVPPGSSSTADLITTNCTTGTLTATQEWLGQWVSPSGTTPPTGCPVIDPFVRSVTYARGQQIAENTTYLVPVGCEATELAVTVRIYLPSGVLAVTATADLKIVPITGG